MANITNHYAPGSCVFQAGSTMNGDVHITGGTFYQGEAKEKELSDTASDTASDADTKNPTHRGPLPKFLFCLNGNEREENVGMRNREKERFLGYLSEHKMSNRKLTCASVDTMNEIIICFIIQWQKKGLIASKPSGNSIFRFLTKECGLGTSVTEKAFANKINLGLKNKQYSIEAWRRVEKYFLL